MDVLQRLLAIVLSQFTQLHALIEVAFDCPDPTGETISIEVAEDDSITGGGRNLRDTMPHGARTDYGYGSNLLGSAFLQILPESPGGELRG